MDGKLGNRGSMFDFWEEMVILFVRIFCIVSLWYCSWMGNKINK